MKFSKLIISSIVMFSLVGFCEAKSDRPDILTNGQHEPSITVRFHFLSENRVTEMCGERGAWGGKVSSSTMMHRVAGREVGCAVIDHEAKTCDIYTPEPKHDGDEAMLNLGHEAYHCYAGRFHE